MCMPPPPTLWAFTKNEFKKTTLNSTARAMIGHYAYLLYDYWQTVRLLQGWRVAWRAKSGHSEHSDPPNYDKHTICILIASKCLHACFVLLKGKHVTHNWINYNLISPYTLPDCDTIPPIVLSYTRNRQNHSVSLAGLWNTRATFQNVEEGWCSWIVLLHPSLLE